MQQIDSGCFYFLAGSMITIVIGCVLFGVMLAMYEFKNNPDQPGAASQKNTHERIPIRGDDGSDS